MIIDVSLPADIGEWQPQPFPGTETARLVGCRCPAEQPWPKGLRFADDCPVHELERVRP